MHYSAWFQGCAFFSLLSTLYLPKDQFRILDIGSYDVNGELRSALHASDLVNKQNVEYIGLDIEAGPNVDVVVSLKDKAFPFPDEYFDVVTSSSALEHDPRFWMTFLKMLRVLRPGGMLYISVPHYQEEHRYPIDCWRFNNDSGEALASWGRENDFLVDLAYSDIFPGIWQSANEKRGTGQDYLMIFYKRPKVDSDSSVVINHFSTFMDMYTKTRTANIFAQTTWARQSRKIGQIDSLCVPGPLTASNGSQYTVNAACELTLIISGAVE